MLNSFAKTRNGLHSYEFPSHLAVEEGDELTIVSLNKEYRSFISSLITDALDHSEKNEIWQDNQDRMFDFLIDLYNRDEMTKSSLIQIDMIATQTISTTLTSLNNSGVTHNFTKPKALIRASLEVLAPTGGGNRGQVRVNVSGTGGGSGGWVWVANGQRHPLLPAISLTGLSLGNHDITLQGQTTSGTMTIAGTTYALQYEILEYD